jgi:serine/threonine protein kinase
VLADLGVAGLAGDGVPWATPGYAAPEVLAGARPGPAADVHGLAAAAWLALTGSVPPPEPERLPLGLLAPDCPPRCWPPSPRRWTPTPTGGRSPASWPLRPGALPGLPVRLGPGRRPSASAPTRR